MGDVLPFDRKPYPDSRTLVAPDGRRWCARSYLYPDDLAKLRHGRAYTPDELVRVYGLATRNGRPGLYLKGGEAMPAEVLYVVEPIDRGLE